MRRIVRIVRAVVLVTMPLFLGGGCASSGVSDFVHPAMDFGHIRRCAVLPFHNLTQDGFADERVQSIFVMEVLREGVLEIAGPGEAVEAMRDLRFSPDASLSPQQIVRLGERLSVDALFLGSIEAYGIDKADPDRQYEVTAVFELVETETGVVVWRAQVHAGGSSIWRRLFGIGSASLYDVARSAVRRALATLF